jgi:hypothetical protein
MRTLLKFTLPVKASNAAIKDGSLGKTIQKVLERLKPEAAYFGPDSGCRAGFIVFNLEDQSDIPSVLEPLFLGLQASVELTPVMNADDLKAGLEKAMRA